MADEKFSFPKLAAKVKDETDAYLFMEDLRWPNGPVCPHCGNDKAYFLSPKNGSRATGQGGKRSIRRVFKCAKCRKQFSVLTGTVFHGTKVPLRTWVLVIFDMMAAKNGISAREVERKYDVDTKTAWFMTHRLREAMKRDPAAPFMRGIIVADETYIGGEPRNRHGHRYGKGGQGVSDKTPVIALVDKGTGEVRSKIIPKVNGANLRAAIAEQVDINASELHTDELRSYYAIGRDMAGHKRVNHLAGEYVSDGASTNVAESYFAQLKRSIDGTHHNESREHLDRYLAEFDFRFSTRSLNDTQRMRRLMGQTGNRRLAYRPLIGE